VILFLLVLAGFVYAVNARSGKQALSTRLYCLRASSPPLKWRRGGLIGIRSPLDGVSFGNG